MKRYVGALVVWLAAAIPAAAAQSCTARPEASLPLVVQGSRLLVEIQVNGVPVRFALDTGAANSVMSEELVQRLKLPTISARAVGAQDIAGGRVEKLAQAIVTLAGRRPPRNYTWRGYPVGKLSVDGLLGSDLLRIFDFDLDFAAARMNLYTRYACDGSAPGPGPVTALSMASLGSSAYGRLNRLRIHVRLDGKPFWAIVDTGASRSYIAAGAALSEFGLDIERMNPGRARGAYGGHLLMAPHQFRELQIGGVSLPSPHLSLTAPDRGFDEGSIVLGLEHLRHLRIFAAYGARRLYVAPAGTTQ